MSKILQNINLGLDEDLREKLTLLSPGWTDYRILRESVDARKSPHFVYTVEVAENGEHLTNPDYPISNIAAGKKPSEMPLIIGSGPAGLFAALRFVERGIPCHLFERGSEAGARIRGINQFWRYGKLDPRNNVCFGEGGAGLYSDGKLITRIKSPHIPYVLQRLVKFGAPAEIQYLANPHVGSDRIRRVLPKLREFLLSHGCQIHYDTQITELLIENKSVVGVKTEHNQVYKSPYVVLATGHSASDMLHHLREQGVFLEGKSFAMGLRIEHPQNLINKIQYKDRAHHPKLGSANYKLAYHDHKQNVGVYSFCMCPGGYVLSSGTEADGYVSNGMSNYKRNSPFANAAIVVTVDHEKLVQSFRKTTVSANDQSANKNQEVFAGLNLRRSLEQKAFQAVQSAGGSRELPGQRLEDFMSGRLSELKAHSIPSGAVPVRLDELLPNFIASKIKDGIEKFDQSMRGFLNSEAQLFGVESRTSCPIRVTRDETSLQSLSHKGLYPCGEGAGYAGGITSAACDGIRVAEAVIKEMQYSVSEQY